jgi:hypothetical protein
LKHTSSPTSAFLDIHFVYGMFSANDGKMFTVKSSMKSGLAGKSTYFLAAFWG